MMLSESTKRSSCKEWIVGRGKHPVTWKTLIEVLYDIELKTLAKEIETAKISPLLF